MKHHLEVAHSSGTNELLHSHAVGVGFRLVHCATQGRQPIAYSQVEEEPALANEAQHSNPAAVPDHFEGGEIDLCS